MSTTFEPPLDWPHYGIRFLPAVRRVFDKYATFNGRASRSEYWWWVLANTIVGTILYPLTFGLGRASKPGQAIGPIGWLFGILFLVFVLATIVPNIAVTCVACTMPATPVGSSCSASSAWASSRRSCACWRPRRTRRSTVRRPRTGTGRSGFRAHPGPGAAAATATAGYGQQQPYGQQQGYGQQQDHPQAGEQQPPQQRG